jgi:hypothetical protein
MSNIAKGVLESHTFDADGLLTCIPEQRATAGYVAIKRCVGRFNCGGSDVRVLDHERKGHIYNDSNLNFAPHSLYAY